jgi:hypothetical protein
MIHLPLRSCASLFLLVSALISSSLDLSGRPVADSKDGTFNIVDFGAVADVRTDNTTAIQKAIDEASIRGGIVLVPPGRWLCRSHLEVKPGVHLMGVNVAPQSWEPQTGSILMPTEGRGDEEGAAFIEMRSSTSISALTIYYPEQDVNDIKPYPWTIRIRANPRSPKDVAFDTTVENITLINSYNGISTGPTENGRHRINSVFGCVLRRGILIDWTGDIGRIENVQFHSHFWANKAFNGNWDKVFDYMQHNLEAFIFGRTDWEYVTNTFVFPANIGYRFIETPNGATNGQFSGIGADASGTAVLVEAVQPQGLLITNGQFNCHRVGRSVQIVIEKTCRGNVRFVNCGFWGPVEHNALLRGEGYTSFSDCYFSNDYDSPEASVAVENGKVQIQNCTFDARSKSRKPGNAFNEPDQRYQPTCIRLAPGVKHAIVRGNNGYYGVDVRNEIGSLAIIEDNEPRLGPKADSEKAHAQ